MFRLGLTGSIGMGKSTTAQMFVDEGCALWDADAAVHRLYGQDGAAITPISAHYPDAIVDGAVSRSALRNIISKDRDALKKIEAIVHPLVAQDREAFLSNPISDIAVLDIPLLFETGGERQMDAVVCVSVSPEEQEKRVLERGTMTHAEFENIRAKQMPNDEKCARSDFVIATDTVEHARAQVQDVVRQIRERLRDA
ncbi:dephospho-CoA kinase [uncultured Roseobacter sp.]|uniref:dephospho-CoA kinase n=1 Tax=uncultured Roseobacter sp. TaxID=114847 RepID=UPI0026153712|nr:dephospho-CoA kinase [uncultured Roseobacter sp.]